MSTTFPAASARVFSTDYDAPEVIQAASLAMGLLKKTKQESMTELLAAIAAKREDVLTALSKVQLTTRQLGLLQRHSTPLGLLRCQPHAHLAYCQDCQAYALTSNTAPTRCQITTGCESKKQHRSKFPAFHPAGEPIPEIEDRPLTAASDPYDSEGTHVCAEDSDTW